jgi:alkanesulfonate monooxygenase SsuD/methylene tetrahydromethanopterin reductase-like flavin-dependent oxidoreductase (luciferase family)
MLAVNAVCAETDEAAARQRAVAEAVYKRMERGVVGTRPGVEAAISELGGVPEPTPARLDADEWPRAVSGSPATLSGLLEQLADRVGVDEVMVHQSTASHEAVRRSHALLADEVGLSPR